MSVNKAGIENAREHFAKLLAAQAERLEKMKEPPAPVDYAGVRPLKIGVAGGDGIGPVICDQARSVLEFLLRDEVKGGGVEFVNIEGLTIENRLRAARAVPEDVLEKIKECHLILKGPTTTPRKGDAGPNIESANVVLRRELDLFANIRPVRVPEKEIDWVFFRENTEGAYLLGSAGSLIGDELAVDFTVATLPGCERIIRLAFDYAVKNSIGRVTAVTKANVVKTTDGLFLDAFYRLASGYPEIESDDWYIDIMTAKLIDPARRSQFKVFVLPNLYGDILTDEAAQIQGGVGTAGSANIGYRWAMFEAIHGSAPRMVKEGRDKYADPFSMIRAAALLLQHIGKTGKAARLDKALDICGQFERRIAVTGRPDGATAAEITAYLQEILVRDDLESRWEEFRSGRGR